MFKEMRRKDRELAAEEAETILESGEYGVLSTVSEDGYAYGVPLSYTYIDNAIYIHCAKEGQKLNNIIYNNKVSFTVVGKTCVLPDIFSTNYESTIVFGTAKEVFDNEKHKGLLGLIKKYSPDHIQEGEEYIDKASAHTKVIKIEIEHISGKSRR